MRWRVSRGCSSRRIQGKKRESFNRPFLGAEEVAEEDDEAEEGEEEMRLSALMLLFHQGMTRTEPEDMGGGRSRVKVAQNEGEP